MSKAKLAYSYIRFSTPEQSWGDSLRRQLEDSEDLAHRHGLTIDRSFTLRDMGISAFRGRNVKEGALAVFLKAVETGRVKPGSTLIVESLDRLSRDEIGDALSLFMSLLNRGIRIATIAPERFYTKKSINDVAGILEPIVYMARAHEESAMKSHRAKNVWKGKRRNLHQKKLTAMAPSWLVLSGDGTRFDCIPERVDIVKRIFRLTIDGHGVDSIARAFNSKGVPTISRKKKGTTWHGSYITKILENRAVLGAFQAHEGDDPVGEVIPDYYPQIIDKATFYKAQNAKRSRRTKRGAIGKRVTNLFSGLLFDARDGATMIVVDKGKRAIGKQVVSSAAKRGVNGSKYIAYPYDALEQTLLKFDQWMQLGDLVPREQDDQQQRIAEKEDELATLEGRLAEIEEELNNEKGRPAKTLARSARKLEARVEEVTGTLEALKAEATISYDTAKSALKELWAQHEKAKGEQLRNLRLKIREKIREAISEIWVLVRKYGRKRIASVQIHFTDGRHIQMHGNTFLLDRYGTQGPDPIQKLPYKLDLKEYRQFCKGAKQRLKEKPPIALCEEVAKARDLYGGEVEKGVGQLISYWIGLDGEPAPKRYVKCVVELAKMIEVEQGRIVTSICFE